ncbi:MAG TPA: gamma-glutamylcyclotransferase, partial [Burkholderiaceae bacterium]|nr:gamma-glutamylcyclotransferase [Burkholderiaceae bacterium]
MSSTYAALHLRDPQPMLGDALRAWGGEQDLWVFGYASLIWRPEFEADEARTAVVHGWHRALEMRSRVNRGTPECPGLVFALVSGGSCRGMVYRIERARAAAELERLWLREMPTGVYDPKWLACRTVHGRVKAL